MAGMPGGGGKELHMECSGRIVVITGAARGIGRAIAERFLQNGDTVVVCDMLYDVAMEWGGQRDDVLVVKCDITDKQSVEAAKAQVIERFGRIDVLVNNAGVVPKPSLLENITEDDWKRTFNVNVNGTFFCTQVFGAEMLDRGGAIVNISSTSGLEPGKNTSAYSATKAAVIMLAKQTAVQWGERNVRCNTVSPGLLYTEINKAFYERPGVYESRVGAIPLGRLGKVEDIANAVFFLASPEASYINGANLVVDGGFTTNALKPINVQV